jgi:hypothetical protein
LAAILIGLIAAIIVGSSMIIDALLESLIPIAFYAERYLETSIAWGEPLDFSGVFSLFFNFGISLIILKFLKSGFEVYTLWQSGDPDLDPMNLVVNFIKALALAVIFPVLYDFLIDITEDLITQVLAQISGMDDARGATEQILNILEDGIFQALAGLLLVVFYILLYISFLARGVEMLILRIGFPVACIGLIDSDKGVFGPYVKKFFQSALTVVIQITLIKLSLAVLKMGNAIYAVAMAYVAIKAPRFLNEFLLHGGGGNVMNTVYHTSRLAQMAKSWGRRR